MPQMKQLTCETCGDPFRVPVSRGRYPRHCIVHASDGEVVQRKVTAMRQQLRPLVDDMAGREGVEFVAAVLVDVVDCALDVGCEADRLALRKAVTRVANAKGPAATRSALLVLAGTALAMGARVPVSVVREPSPSCDVEVSSQAA